MRRFPREIIALGVSSKEYEDMLLVEQIEQDIVSESRRAAEENQKIW